ncbi:MAG: endolytic transglycosylase MltG [Actinomycetota bacterium]
MSKALVAVGVVAGLLVAGGAVVILLYRSATSAGRSDGREVSVMVEPGTSGRDIAQQLEQEGVVSSALAFRIFLRMRGVGADLKAGEYKLREEMPFPDVVAALEKGPPVDFAKLTIPEGLNAEQTAAKVGSTTHIPADQFLQAATAATVPPSILPPGGQTLEGFLYPSTYHVIERETAPDLVKRMVAEFEKQVARAPMGKAAALGRSPYEILVVASMIEEEAKADEERPMISAVIHNRLARGMELGIDASVQYAVRKYEGQPLTQSDLAVDSPYNTRTRPGLPPTPIASPRLGSIVAALEPAQTGALWFVLSADCVHHRFTASYDEFLRAKARGCRTP